MSTTMTESRPRTDRGARQPTAIFSALVGLAGLAILLQGVWAGIFLEHDGARDSSGGWIDVHARGGEVSILLTLLAVGVVAAKLRQRRDLLVGGIALLVLLVFESYLGGLIRDDGKDTLTAVHVPLAMAIMGLAAWLPFRARRPVAR
ncbi:MAG TPA: hypothetical protein VMB79_00725 [Jatrophihabitans sp.]|nr:hypothetical protein [Jatrophihabitans sp.]